MLRCNQLDPGIPHQSPVSERLKWNEGIILGVNDQRRQTDRPKIPDRTRARIVITRISKSIVGLEIVIPIPEMTNTIQSTEVVPPRKETTLFAHRPRQTTDEPCLIDTIARLPNRP